MLVFNHIEGVTEITGNFCNKIIVIYRVFMRILI